MKKIISVLAIILSVVLMATPAFAAVAVPVSAPVVEHSSIAATAEPSGAEPSAAAPSAYALYKNAIKKMGDISSMRINGEARTTMIVDGKKTPSIARFDAVQVISEDDIQMIMTMNDIDTGMTTTTYYKDGVMYVNLNNEERMKMVMDIEEMVETSYSFDMDMEKSMFDNAVVTDAPNGKLITIDLSKTMLQDLMDDATGGALDGIDSTISSRITKMTMGMEVEFDGTIRAYTMAMDYTLTLGDSKIVSTIEVDMNIGALNDIDILAFPTNLDTYTAI